MKISHILITIAYLVLAPELVLAHPQLALGSAVGALAGFLHPFSGLDHLLAMTTIGLLAAQIGGRVAWLLPATFIAAMIIGGLTGLATSAFFSVELGLALSVACLGVAVMFGGKLPTAFACGMAAVFGFFHGHAHGTEIPEMASPFLYTAGFVAATSVLHALGLAIGTAAKQHAHGITGLRLSGAAIATSGLVMTTAVCIAH